MHIIDTTLVVGTIRFAQLNCSGICSTFDWADMISGIIIAIAAIYSIIHYSKEFKKTDDKVEMLIEMEVEPDEKEAIPPMTIREFLILESDYSKKKVMEEFVNSLYKFRTLEGLMKGAGIKEEIAVRKILIGFMGKGFVRKVILKNRELWALVKKP